MGLLKNEPDPITRLCCEFEKEQKRQQFFETMRGEFIRLSAIDYLNPDTTMVILRSGETLYLGVLDSNRLKRVLFGEAETDDAR